MLGLSGHKAINPNCVSHRLRSRLFGAAKAFPIGDAFQTTNIPVNKLYEIHNV